MEGGVVVVGAVDLRQQLQPHAHLGTSVVAVAGRYWVAAGGCVDGGWVRECGLVV